MKKSDERISLDKEYENLKKNRQIPEDVKSFTDSLFELLDKTELRLEALEDRISKLEDFSDIISMDLFDIQSGLMKKINLQNIPNLENIAVSSFFGDDEDEETEHDFSLGEEDENDGNEEFEFARCPHCNTVIFLNDEEKIVCPFCGETFNCEDLQ